MAAVGQPGRLSPSGTPKVELLRRAARSMCRAGSTALTSAARSTTCRSTTRPAIAGVRVHRCPRRAPVWRRRRSTVSCTSSADTTRWARATPRSTSTTRRPTHTPVGRRCLPSRATCPVFFSPARSTSSAAARRRARSTPTTQAPTAGAPSLRCPRQAAPARAATALCSMVSCGSSAAWACRLISRCGSTTRAPTAGGPGRRTTSITRGPAARCTTIAASSLAVAAHPVARRRSSRSGRVGLHHLRRHHHHRLHLRHLHRLRLRHHRHLAATLTSSSPMRTPKVLRRCWFRRSWRPARRRSTRSTQRPARRLWHSSSRTPASFRSAIRRLPTRPRSATTWPTTWTVAVSSSRPGSASTGPTSRTGSTVGG